jgi:hypothetical protein
MPWLLSNVYSLSVFYREKRADLLHLSATFFLKKMIAYVMTSALLQSFLL